MGDLTLATIQAAQRMLDAASVPMEHRRVAVCDETGAYLQCSCGLRDYLEEEFDWRDKPLRGERARG